MEYDGRFAGSTSLRPDRDGNAEIAFGLAAWARGRHVTSRSVRMLLDWGFRERSFGVVYWRANVGNWPSRRVAWATGFTFGPTIPRLLDHRGSRVDGWTAWTTVDNPRRPASPWLETPILETPRLRLRPWRVEDGPRLVEASNDKRLRRFIPASPLPRGPQMVLDYVRRVHLAAAEGSRLAWCVADRSTDDALGNVAIFDFEGGTEGSHTAQLGFWAHPAARGRGVVTAAVRRIANWSLTDRPHGFGLRRLYLLTAVSNTASRHVAEEAGFVHVGTERAAAPVGDHFEDNTIYDRLRD
jgi:RimJ/RimL family protein N-acetyltransferase